jgi:hypothetical protein
VESCTAIAEHHDGRFEIITWTDKLQEHRHDEGQDEEPPLEIRAA